MKIEIDLYSLEQLRAFATFITTLAEAREGEVREKLAAYHGEGALGGSINRDPNTAWRDEGGAALNPLVVNEKAFLGEQAANTTTAPTRKRGEPSPGHKRRTKAEIAEDEAAERDTAKKEDAQTSAISTGGERVGPDDEPEVEQQDAADEASETAQAGAELSHENLRDALGKYVQKFGMDAAQLDGPKLFALVFKDPAITKISAVPADQASLKKALDGVNEMLAKNPFDRTAVA